MEHDQLGAGRAPGVLLHRLSGELDNLVSRGIAAQIEPDVVELFVPDEEAASGGMVCVRMRVPADGDARALFSAWLAIPPGVEDRALLHPSALLPGMRPIVFRVRR